MAAVLLNLTLLVPFTLEALIYLTKHGSMTGKYQHGHKLMISFKVGRSMVALPWKAEEYTTTFQNEGSLA